MGAVANRPKLTGLLANDKKIWKCFFLSYICTVTLGIETQGAYRSRTSILGVTFLYLYCCQTICNFLTVSAFPYHKFCRSNALDVAMHFVHFYKMKIL